jgi:hypothetical protein
MMQHGADPGRLNGQIIVEPDQHLELGQRLIAGPETTQSVRQSAGGISNDERVPGVGLGVARVQISDPAHRQTRQIGHVMATSPGHRHRQRTNRGRLIDHHQHPPMPSQPLEHRPQPRLGVRQRRVKQPATGRIQPHRVMLTLADIQTNKHLILTHGQQPFRHVAARPTSQASTAGNHVTTRPTNRRLCPYQRSLDATRPGDNTPRIIKRLGGKVIPSPATRPPLTGATKTVTGGSARSRRDEERSDEERLRSTRGLEN